MLTYSTLGSKVF